MSICAAGAAGPVDGPAVSVDDILKKYEAAKAKAAAGTKGSKAGGKDSKRDDESRLLPESQLRRLMELQGLSKVGSAVRDSGYLSNTCITKMFLYICSSKCLVM